MFQKSTTKKNKGERVREADGKRAKKITLAPSLIGRGYGGGFIKNVLLALFILLLSTKVFAAPALQPDKTLNLTINTAHLLTFDEKIINYKFENEKNFQAEILSNIFNNRQELLIIPLNKLDNKLTVWTASKIYNFSIKFEINKTNSKILPKDNSGMVDFDLDNPPIPISKIKPEIENEKIRASESPKATESEPKK